MNSIHTRQNPLDSHELSAFVAFARTGCFSDTARELFLTHSALSLSVRALENELACRLLNRLGKRIELTVAGESFLPLAQSGLDSFSQGHQTVNKFKQRGSQRLTDASFWVREPWQLALSRLKFTNE